MRNLSPWILRVIISAFALLSFHTAQADDLVVGVNPEYKPLVYKEEGKLTGIELATASATAELLNKKLILKELQWDDLIPALQRGDIDVIMSGMSITEERQKQVDFSHSYLEVGQMAIISMKHLNRFAAPTAMFQPGVRVGVETGTTGEDYAKQFLATAELKTFTNPSTAFEALRADDIDFFIHDAPTSWKIAQSSEYSDLFALYRPLTKESLAWAVKKGNQSLLAELNQALTALESNGKLKLIQDHWMPVKVQVGQ